MGYKVNHQISHSFLTVILPDGVNLGVISRDKALFEARKYNLDLIQISKDDERNPICKIADYGKIRYNESKKKKNNNSTDTTKEIWIHYNTGDHDIEFKNKRVHEFLEKKYKVLYGIELKGRDMRVANMVELVERLDGILDGFKDKASWSKPKVSGRIISTTLIPK